MKFHGSHKLFIFIMLGVFYSSLAIASVPEPQSTGKYTVGKGTKSDENYEARAGAPIYTYGKGLQLGPVHVKPNASYSMRYDNNVFYEENGRKSDVVNNLTTDTIAELPLNAGQHLFTAGFKTNSEWFNRYDTQDHTNYTGKVGLDLNFVPFTLNLEDAYERTFSRANTEFTDRIERDENAFHSLLEVPFSMFFLENEITNFTEDFQRAVDSTFDHNDFTVYQRVGYEWTPSTQLLAEYAYKNIRYFEVDDRDGDAHQLMGGLRGNLTELISYQAWLGGQFRVYDEDSRPDFNGVVARGSLLYEPSETNQITLKADRAPQESTFDNQSFYVRNRLELLWRKQIMERTFFQARQTLSYNEYSRITVRDNTERTRRDYVWSTNFGLEYRMPNELISFTLDYTYSARNSNIATLGYDDQTISGGVRAYF